MSDEDNFGIVFWGPDSDEGLSAAEGHAYLLVDNIHGRVCRIIGEEGPLTVVRCAGSIFKVSADRIRPVSNVKFEVGDKVRCKDKMGEVIDSIWHFNREEPFYILKFGGKNSSRRYFGEELDAELRSE